MGWLHFGPAREVWQLAAAAKARVAPGESLCDGDFRSGMATTVDRSVTALAIHRNTCKAIRLRPMDLCQIDTFRSRRRPG